MKSEMLTMPNNAQHVAATTSRIYSPPGHRIKDEIAMDRFASLLTASIRVQNEQINDQKVFDKRRRQRDESVTYSMINYIRSTCAYRRN